MDNLDLETVFWRHVLLRLRLRLWMLLRPDQLETRVHQGGRMLDICSRMEPGETMLLGMAAAMQTLRQSQAAGIGAMIGIGAMLAVFMFNAKLQGEVS